MPDYAVHITIINDTSEHLDRDPSGTSANLGHWVDLPQSISAHDKAVFQIADDPGWYGSDANNAFFVKTNIDDSPRARIHTYECCPYGGGSNQFTILDDLTPASVYVASFRAKVGGGDWQYNSVPPGGAPLTVEYTITYQSSRYRFTLVEIAAVSDHPVRNSRDELITGFHSLWRSDSAPSWADGQRGSYAPNIFAYDFEKQVAEAGHIDVTVRPLDIQLLGAEVLVYGSINGKRVFQTDFFFLKSLGNVTVSAHVVDPVRSTDPFGKNADVDWGMELRQSSRQVEAVGPHTTRLELYWLGQQTHAAFWNGYPVGFLRAAFDASTSVDLDYKGDGGGEAAITRLNWYANATRRAFGKFNKIYDTSRGESAFGMGMWGGIFWESYYLAVAPGSDQQGTLYRRVNCFDQAGMLELLCSLGVNNRHSHPDYHPTSWLAQQPFGYIKTTKLVGIADDYGRLIDVNNPFFGTERSRALVANDDQGRTAFGCHVYVGNSKPFDLTNDAVYDACGGPHAGTEDAADYLVASRQEYSETPLYAWTHSSPGTVGNIMVGEGVTGIDGRPYQPGGPTTRPRPSRGPATLTQLVGTPQAQPGFSITHTEWAHVDDWVTDVLGGEWSVLFKGIAASRGSARAFWHLAAEGVESPVRVSVVVESVVTDDGGLNATQSAAAARDRAADILLSTERDPEEVWARGELDEYGDYSIQYSPTITGGRIVVVAANTVVDIAGMDSSATLEPIARQLLGRVVRRNAVLPAVPVLRAGRMGSGDRGGHSVAVQGINTRFTLEFDINSEVYVAGATCDGGRVLLDKYEIENAGQGSKVRFVLVTRVLGTHVVSLHVAHDETMVCATHIVNVIVE